MSNINILGASLVMFYVGVLVLAILWLCCGIRQVWRDNQEPTPNVKVQPPLKVKLLLMCRTLRS